MTNEELIAEINRMGEGSYRELRMLEDETIVGIGELMFTTAIYMDMHLYGWGRRYCFENRELAEHEFKQLVSGNDNPVGWVARR